VKNRNQIELTEKEMLGLTGGARSPFLCWAGGFTAVVGFATLDPIVATAGVWFVYTYC
jgi:hypothetical protein